MFQIAKLRAAILIFFGIIIVFKSYVVVIGQTTRPVLAVLNKADNSLTLIDPASMKVTSRVPVGDSPHEVVLSADGKTAFVANYGAQTPGSSLSVIDTATAKELRRVDLSPLLRPHGMQVIGGKVYFTAEVNRLIARYDPAADKVDWVMGTGQNGTHMIAAAADQKKFYVTNVGSDSITAFEFQNVPPAGSKITQIAVGKQPEAIDLSPDGREVWAGLNVDGAIDVIDTAAGKAKERINIGGRPYRVRFSPDGKMAAATLVQTRELLLLDTATRKETKRIKLESVPLAIVFSADGRTAFLTVVEPDAVLKIDLQKGEIVGRVDAGKGPDGIAVTGI